MVHLSLSKVALMILLILFTMGFEFLLMNDLGNSVGSLLKQQN